MPFPCQLFNGIFVRKGTRTHITVITGFRFFSNFYDLKHELQNDIIIRHIISLSALMLLPGDSFAKVMTVKMSPETAWQTMTDRMNIRSPLSRLQHVVDEMSTETSQSLGWWESKAKKLTKIRWCKTSKHLLSEIEDKLTGIDSRMTDLCDFV